MTDGKEKAVDLNIKNLTIFPKYSNASHPVPISKHFLRAAVPEDFDVLSIIHPLLHGLRSPEDIPADYHVDLAAKIRQVCRLLASSVTAPDYGYGLVPVEESVASSASRNPHAFELFLGRQA